MDRGPSVADHQNKLGPREKFREVDSLLHRERILVAQTFRRLTVFGNYLHDERSNSRVQHLQKTRTFISFAVILYVFTCVSYLKKKIELADF